MFYEFNNFMVTESICFGSPLRTTTFPRLNGSFSATFFRNRALHVFH
jgi:hypothetical protein